MEASTTVNKMLAGNKIFVPTYQRAYSWDTEFDKSKTPKHVNVFLTDLEDYNKSSATTPYYFGHFLFEEKSESNFGVIDGQQRLTTIVIPKIRKSIILKKAIYFGRRSNCYFQDFTPFFSQCIKLSTKMCLLFANLRGENVIFHPSFNVKT